jgi:hypothetical protein
VSFSTKPFFEGYNTLLKRTSVYIVGQDDN